MKQPIPAPAVGDAFKAVLASRAAFERYLADEDSPRLTPVSGGKYLHWDRFRNLTPPDGWTAEQAWMRVKLARQSLYQDLPFTDRKGVPFVFALPLPVLELLHHIERDLHWESAVSATLVSDTPYSVLADILADEAAASSQLDGAETGGEQGRTLEALRYVRRLGGEPLTVAGLVELNRIIAPEAQGETPAPELLSSLVDFANGVAPAFIPPPVRATLLHFWLVQAQPFADGNGRTGRALFFWAMARAGYVHCAHLALSPILLRVHEAYARSVLYALTDENDATYFVILQLRALRIAMRELQLRIAAKASQAYSIERALRRGNWMVEELNGRQLELLTQAIQDPSAEFTVEGHKASQGIVYQTARTDLLTLAERGLLEQGKRGKAFVFTPSAALREIRDPG